jgi:hypothetical protein
MGDLLGVLGHVESPWMFGGWVELSPSVQESTATWVTWGICLLISISPAIAALARKRIRPEPIVVLTFLIFPLLSLLVVLALPRVSATLLVGSGFLVAYAVTSRSRTLLGIEPSCARRQVLGVVFTLLTLTAVGGVMCVLLWQAGVFFASTSGINQIVADILLTIMATDLKAFYLAQPILTATFLAIAVAAIVALFREPARWLSEPILKLLTKGKGRGDKARAPQRRSGTHSSLASLTLVGALGLGIATTIYPLIRLHWSGGADFSWYMMNLRPIHSLSDVVSLLRGDRGLFLVLLSLAGTVMGANRQDLVSFAPAMLSVLLALSTFYLVKEGTRRLWVSSFAAVLSVVSAQTTLGMYGGIIANWFALSVANFMFAMIIRSIRLRSPVMAVGSIGLSLALLAAYAYLWLVAVVELLLALVGSIAAFGRNNSRGWKYDVGILSAAIVSIMLIPIVFLSSLGPDPTALFALGWQYVEAAGSQTIASAVSALGSSLAASRMRLPFVALLSILGLLDHAPQTRCFTKIIAAMVLVPFAIELVSNAPSYFPLRGLYLTPLYVLAALGAENIICRVNGHVSPWKIRGGLAFAGMFGAYLFLSQLRYTLMMFGLPLLPSP